MQSCGPLNGEKRGVVCYTVLRTVQRTVRTYGATIGHSAFVLCAFSVSTIVTQCCPEAGYYRKIGNSGIRIFPDPRQPKIALGHYRKTHRNSLIREVASKFPFGTWTENPEPNAYSGLFVFLPAKKIRKSENPNRNIDS